MATILTIALIMNSNCGWNNNTDTVYPDTSLYHNTESLSLHSDNRLTGMNGSGVSTFHRAGIPENRLRSNVIMISGKLRNRRIRARNGNRNSNSILKVLNWNTGSKLWQNKLLEVENLLVDKQPDICYVSEANLWDDLEVDNRNIPGYQLLLPKTMAKLKHARIVLLVKNDLIVHEMREHMDEDTAVIWIRVGQDKRNSMTVGGVYRQHKLLGGHQKDATRLEVQRQQENRWRRICSRWKNIAKNNKCVVVGDINLDYLRWTNPKQHLEKMVDETKNVIETSGFLQLVSGYTRTWRTHADSCLDHVWSNCPNRTIKVINESRGASDHNMVGIHVSIRNIKSGGNNIVKRLWKQFDKDECVRRFKLIDWKDIMDEVNVNVASSRLEEEICTIMDEMAPMKTVQVRTKFNNWILVMIQKKRWPSEMQPEH